MLQALLRHPKTSCRVDGDLQTAALIRKLGLIQECNPAQPQAPALHDVTVGHVLERPRDTLLICNVNATASNHMARLALRHLPYVDLHKPLLFHAFLPPKATQIHVHTGNPSGFQVRALVHLVIDSAIPHVALCVKASPLIVQPKRCVVVGFMLPERLFHMFPDAFTSAVSSRFLRFVPISPRHLNLPACPPQRVSFCWKAKVDAIHNGRVWPAVLHQCERWHRRIRRPGGE
mmetsp:Transcript_64484/g.127491  ORF Transcript_64484/g.127491 Transcript_64484/m.127491 type:complete len:232 (+) Transcript_64484:2262-2957(+)